MKVPKFFRHVDFYFLTPHPVHYFCCCVYAYPDSAVLSAVTTLYLQVRGRHLCPVRIPMDPVSETDILGRVCSFL